MSTVNPLIANAPKEVALPKAPLVRVIAQLRFPLIVSIEKRDFIAPLQEALRSSYPVLRVEQTQGIVMGPQGVSPINPQTTWRFNDLTEKWRVSLAPDFVALETTAYVSRKDFIDRFRVVVDALAKHVQPMQTDRLGIRYIDRLEADALNGVNKLVRKEILGVLDTPLSASVRHTLSESLLELPNDALMILRYGQLPPGQTVDRAAIEPVDHASWLLDLDVFTQKSKPFDPAAVIEEVRSFAERSYAVFRWAVTDDFLRLFGGAI